MTGALPDTGVLERLIETRGGRVLSVQEGGDPAGRAVLAQFGTPNSRILYRPHLLDATERGIRLISYDRPGYGGSTSQPGRAIADCVADVRSIIDTLDIERLAVWGISGGGPHALACAALLGDRVVAAATLASCAPFDAHGLDWYAGAGQENADDFARVASDPAAARAKLARDREELLSASPADVVALHPTVYSPADVAVLSEELAAYYRRRDEDGLAPGIEGWWQDSVALVKSWGFSVQAIRVPVMVWHGRQDRMVPFAHGEWLAGHIPHAEAQLTDEDGHITLLQNRVPLVHDWLLKHF